MTDHFLENRSHEQPEGMGQDGGRPRPSRIGEEVIMKVLCAWCEQEGQQALMREAAPWDTPSISHGICHAHEKRMLLEIQKSGKKDSIRRIPRRLSLPNARGNTAPITVMYL